MTQLDGRRLRWRIPLLLAVAAALGWSGFHRIDRLFTPPPPPRPVPVFAEADGLPEKLVSGQSYIAVFAVSYPANWIEEDKGQEPRSKGAQLVGVLRRGTLQEAPAGMQNESLFCTEAMKDAAGRTLVMRCPMDAPAPGPLILRLVASPAGGGVLLGDPSLLFTKDYHHTVVARS